MSTYTLISFFAFAMSATCGFVMIPQILSFCKKRKLYDTPDARKIHKNAIPRLGGVSFMAEYAGGYTRGPADVGLYEYRE